MYKNKYLKYKQKYIALKQLGGTTEADKIVFSLASKEESKRADDSINTGVYDDTCPISYYNYAGLDFHNIEIQCNKIKNESEKCIDIPIDRINANIILDETQKNILKNYNARISDGKIKKVCQSNEPNQIYFKPNLDVIIQDIATGDIILPELRNTILLNIDNYLNVSLNREMIVNKSLICLEGNLLYCDKDCLIGSGSITSCVFFVLYLADNNKIVFHLNSMLSNISNVPVFINDRIKYDFSHTNCFSFIRDNYAAVINQIHKVAIFGVLEDYYIPILDAREDADIYSIMDLGYNIPNDYVNLLVAPIENIKRYIKRKLGIPIDIIINKYMDENHFIVAKENIYKLN